MSRLIYTESLYETQIKYVESVCFTASSSTMEILTFQKMHI